ncbi:transmembrane protein 180, partial [Biomphalaria glabrata]
FTMSISMETAYGSLTLFTSILHNVFLLYHIDIFVSVYKIDKTSFWFGETLFLIWNSLNDPIFGWISDKKLLGIVSNNSSVTNIVWSRLGALQLYGPLFSCAFVLFWVHWAWPGLQFAVCLCLYDGFLTMIDLHHSALLADLSLSDSVRTKLNSRCSLFSAIGSISVFLSYLVWNKIDLTTFRIFCFVLATISFIGYLKMVKVLKKAYIKYSKDSQVQIDLQEQSVTDSFSGQESKASILKFGRQLLSHRNFLWFAFLNLVQVFHCHFNSNFFPLFLDTLLGDAVSPTVASGLLSISFIAPHINNLYFLSLCKKYGVYSVIRCLFLIKLALAIVMYHVGPEHIWMLAFFIASNRVFTEGTCKLLNLVISDLVDEDVVLHSRPQAVSALVFGTAALVSKPGQTLAPVIGTWILALQTGHDIFQSGNEDGSIKLDLSKMDSAVRLAYKQGVFMMLICVPVVCAILQLLAWSRYTLKGQRLAQIKSFRAKLHHIPV